MKKQNVVFCGTPDFSVPTLELLNNHPSINVVKVITMPDRPSGRGQKVHSPPVAVFAKENKISLFQTPNINKESDFLDELEKMEIDFFIVLAFAQILKKRVLELPRLGLFNIHTSLLPKYRGAAPIQYALLNGDSVTGVSIQRITSKLDAGDVALSYPIDIAPNETGGQLYVRLKLLSALCANNFINDLLNDSAVFKKQDELKVSFAPSLKKEQGHLDFKKCKIDDIKNQIRAFDPWPGVYCFLNKKRMKVLAVERDEKSLRPGELSTEFNTLLVGCLDGTLRLCTVQLECKKICKDIELMNGLKNKEDKFDLE